MSLNEREWFSADNLYQQVMADCMDSERLKKLLLQQQHDLLQVRESGSRAAGTVTLDQTSVGRLSRMDALQSQAMLQEAVRRREQSLRDIGDALRRIENDDYGFCEECGMEIADKRLQFNPTVRYCVDCSSKLEDE